MTPMALLLEESRAISTGSKSVARNSGLRHTKPALAGKMEPNEKTPPVAEDAKVPTFPEIPFTRALVVDPTAEDGQAKQVPQAIAHRGYKAMYPENTMSAFKAAVKVGAHAIETDIHLSKDGVVVLSHIDQDGTLKRCFGVDKKEPMPRLSELLEYLAMPEAGHLWLFLDVKRDDDPEELLSLTRRTIDHAETAVRKDNGQAKPWKDRIVVGGWSEDYISLITKMFPGFGAALIGFSVKYARQFFEVPNLGFNMLQKILVGPIGSRFIKDVRAADRPLFLWTVNDEEWMDWSINKKVDGVITDDPKLFLEVCKRATDGDFEGPGGHYGSRGRRQVPLRRKAKLYAQIAWAQILIFVMSWYFFASLKKQHGRKVDK
ncbi:PLC-like phosphodiesterase [Zalerion maritima]|uniref:PLC-like phosphodiesterase n=1 Tax=Zalerion maritima TaxID=339359 RepID=A0AAD5RH22_9PEZI|nr:PLC-like phosphodiesterase [Zalerion maritima]